MLRIETVAILKPLKMSHKKIIYSDFLDTLSCAENLALRFVVRTNTLGLLRNYEYHVHAHSTILLHLK